MNGLLITFEGIEGCGKSTQARLLHDWLRDLGENVLLTREPGGTPLGEKIREVLLHSPDTKIDPLTELLLYLACRAQIVREVIKPALDAGFVVLVDRFYDSTLAYQGYGRELDIQKIHEVNRWATGGIVPNLTFVFDLDPETGLARATGRHRDGGPDRMEAEQLAFHRKVRRGFVEIAQQEGRCRLLDAEGSVDSLQSEVRSIYSEFVKSGRS